MDTIGPIGYCELNTLMDDAFPKGALNYWKSNFLTQLSDDAIDTMVNAFSKCPAPLGQVLLEHFHGRVTQIPISETAVPHRSEAFNFLALSQWLETSDNDLCIGWAEQTRP